MFLYTEAYNNVIEIQGSGFSASGASKSFEFTNPVTGTITTDDNESNGEDFSEE